jgi:hypothetical protein
MSDVFDTSLMSSGSGSVHVYEPAAKSLKLTPALCVIPSEGSNVAGIKSQRKGVDEESETGSRWSNSSESQIA